jgi:hypothetical protein
MTMTTKKIKLCVFHIEGSYRERFFCFLLSCVIAVLFVVAAPRQANAQGNSKSKNHPLCTAIANKQLEASAGAQMFCFGPQANGPNASKAVTSQSSTTSGANSPRTGTFSFSRNVNAASLAEDVTPSGVRAFGQSEVSIAAAGPYLVEAWNDATGFFSLCPSPMNKNQLTGFGFSNNGGASFTDLGGTPADCTIANEGDPAVEAYTVGGNTYFYIAQITIPLTILENGIGLNACQVTGSGPSATLSCNNTILAAISSDCFSGFFCSFLDKDFVTIDPGRKRLYISYTEFGVNTVSFAGQVEVAECDISNPMAPVCSNGSAGTQAPPYLAVVSDPNCENEGAYPAVDIKTGDLYVANEFNWFTNIFSGACLNTPTQELVNRIPFSCLPMSGVSSCSPPFAGNAVNIVSMDAAFIPGYNRFPMNDFPRIAVSNAAGTVSIVWNDSGRNPLGDVLLQSFNLGSLSLVQSVPVKLNNDVGSVLHFLPALRNASSTGLLNVSWYDRRLHPNTAITDVYAAVGIAPRTTTTPKSNERVTDTSSDWNSVSSDIVPNFGDYTDNYVGLPSGSATASTLFVTWSDGRLGDPQPFVSEAGLKK